MHLAESCPFCQYEGELAGEALKEARFVHAELLQLDEHLSGYRQRMAPIEKVREQTLRNLKRVLGLEVEEPEGEDLWAR